MVKRILLLLALLASPLLAVATPDIPLQDLQGKSHNANEYIGRGKLVVVVVWAHDCGVCAREIHEMTSFHRAHASRDAVVLGISLDGKAKVEAARKFVRDHKLPFPNLLIEPSQEVMQRFGAGEFVGTPTYYVYDPQGELVAQQVGPLSRKEVEAFMDELRREAAKPL